MSLIDDPKMREVFEKMTGRFRIPTEQLQKDENGEYLDKETASYWVVFGIAWAESREALVIELPIDVTGGLYRLAVEDCARCIEAAGVKVKP